MKLTRFLGSPRLYVALTVPAAASMASPRPALAAEVDATPASATPAPGAPVAEAVAPRARLVLPEKLAGHIYVRDAEGRLVAELQKEPTYPLDLRLAAGAYRVVLQRDGRAAEAAVTLVAGAEESLGEARFTAVLPPLNTDGAAEGAARATSAASQASDHSATAGADAAIGARASFGPAPSATGERPLVDVPVDIGIWPSLRSHAGERVRNRFVLGLLVGASDVLDGVQLSLGGSVVEERMRGLQMSNIFNIARGDGKGAQLSSGVNISDGSFRGLQLAPVNVARGRFEGAALGVVNTAVGETHGAQIGVANVSWGELHGTQIGVANVSRAHHGAAVGVVNVAGERDGFALGLVNVQKKHKGFSMGLVNVSDEAEDDSLGLLFNWSNDGIHAVDVFASEVTPMALGFKTGTRHLYTQWEVGFSPGSAAAKDEVPTRGSRRYALGLGLGWRGRPTGRTFVDVGLMNHRVQSQIASGSGANEDHTLSSLRVMVGYQLLSHLALVGGLSYNVAVGWNGADLDLGPSWAESVQRSGATTVRMYPGFVAGVEL